MTPWPVPAAPAAAAKPAAPKPAAPLAQSVKIPTLQKPEEPGPVSESIQPEESGDAVSPKDALYSKIYLISALIALICMIYGTLLVTVQFLDLTQGQKTAEAVSFIVPGSK